MARSELEPARVAGTPGAIHLESVVQWREPVDVFTLLRAAGEDPMLLDGMGAHPEARHAYVTAGWLLEATLADGAVEERHPSGAIEAVPDEPLAYLRQAFASTQRAGAASDGVFRGGWVVAFGLGFARILEPSLPARRDDAWPQALLRKVGAVVAFDRNARTATLHVTDLDGDATGARERLSALARLLDEAGRGGEADGPSIPPAQAPAWELHADQASFEAMVRAARGLVHDGDLFQVNLATSHSTLAALEDVALFRHLAATNPSPYMGILPFSQATIVSGSPEQLFATQGGKVRARPIAGTRGRGFDACSDAAKEAELRGDPKERAEHLMLVDLARNDLARVCEPGTVHVPELAAVERYRNVMHLASRVEGTLRAGTDVVDWLTATFPGGTVTGAPKLRATQRLLELEPVPRGFYTGSVGWVGDAGDGHLNILIRSLVRDAGGRWHAHAGSGIVADSEPEREWREALRKARGMLDAAASAPPATPAARLGEVAPGASWDPPPAARGAGVGARVLALDNQDSFVGNLVDYLRGLGATVVVVRNDEPGWRAAVDLVRPTHILLSPGPGWPDDAGCMPDLLRELAGTAPILGVCLGHQAMARLAGARVERHPAGPVHGKPDQVTHDGAGPFAGLAAPLQAMRYHSLVVTEPAAPWVVDARLADGTVMAMRHPGLRLTGLQFHPESIGTPEGLALLANWLRGA